jgi:hypothetical protein
VKRLPTFSSKVRLSSLSFLADRICEKPAQTADLTTIIQPEIPLDENEHA